MPPSTGDNAEALGSLLGDRLLLEKHTAVVRQPLVDSSVSQPVVEAAFYVCSGGLRRLCILGCSCLHLLLLVSRRKTSRRGAAGELVHGLLAFLRGHRRRDGLQRNLRRQGLFTWGRCHLVGLIDLNSYRSIG